MRPYCLLVENIGRKPKSVLLRARAPDRNENATVEFVSSCFKFWAKRELLASFLVLVPSIFFHCFILAVWVVLVCVLSLFQSFQFFLYVDCVCLCFLILHWAWNTSAQEKVDAWEPETLSTGPLLGPEIVQIFAKCWGGLQSKGCNSWEQLDCFWSKDVFKTSSI